MSTALWVDRFARVGYSAKAVVYAGIALLAFNEALGVDRDSPDAEAALRTFSSHAWGWLVLIPLMLGLACYVVWRMVTTFEPGEQGESWPAMIGERLARFASGLAYAGIAITAAKKLIGYRTQDDEARTQEMADAAMRQPMGEWLVVLIGVVVLGVGVRFLVEAWRADYRKRFSIREGPGVIRRSADWISRIGIAARGVVFVLMGGCLVQAGWKANAGAAHGMGQILKSLDTQPYGAWLLGAMSVGLAAYAAYCVVRARYGHIG